MLALAAQHTERIGLGILLDNPVGRGAEVLASSIATVDMLAPGRTMLCLGAGDTAVRMVGKRPARIAETEEATRIVRELARIAHEGVVYHFDFWPIRQSLSLSNILLHSLHTKGLKRVATGPNGEKRPTGVIANAVHMMRVVTGQAEEEYIDTSKREGGRQGGKARSASLSSERRQEIAKAAAAKRWE